MVNRRAKVPEQEWWDIPHHLSTCNGRDSPNVLVLQKLVEQCSCTAVVTRWKYLSSTLRGVAEGMIDLIKVSVRETACHNDEDPDGKGRMSVSVRKHQDQRWCRSVFAKWFVDMYRVWI
jgi:hypothetical protein